jgi:hypothetical protein
MRPAFNHGQLTAGGSITKKPRDRESSELRERARDVGSHPSCHPNNETELQRSVNRVHVKALEFGIVKPFGSDAAEIGLLEPAQPHRVSATCAESEPEMKGGGRGWNRTTDPSRVKRMLYR